MRTFEHKGLNDNIQQKVTYLKGLHSLLVNTHYILSFVAGYRR